MDTILTSATLRDFATELRLRRFLPRNVEVAKVGPIFMASVFDSMSSKVISESVSCGMDPDPNLAVMKGLVESVERQAFRKGKERSLSSCATDRSDGFAAFPKMYQKQGDQDIARDNALNEAIERYVWSKWWDEAQIGHTIESVPLWEGPTLSYKLLKEVTSFLPLRSVYRILPRFSESSKTVSIYFAFLEPTGVISGGACGNSSDIERTNCRALYELCRHALAMYRAN